MSRNTKDPVNKPKGNPNNLQKLRFYVRLHQRIIDKFNAEVAAGGGERRHLVEALLKPAEKRVLGVINELVEVEGFKGANPSEQTEAVWLELKELAKRDTKNDKDMDIDAELNDKEVIKGGGA